VSLGAPSARFTELTSSIERDLVVALDGPDAGSESDDADWLQYPNLPIIGYT